MSRIFEALQRAELERKTAHESDFIQVAEPMFVPDNEDAPAARDVVALGNITQHPWEPSIPFFPTLSERGAAVEQFRSLRSRIQ